MDQTVAPEVAREPGVTGGFLGETSSQSGLSGGTKGVVQGVAGLGKGRCSGPGHDFLILGQGGRAGVFDSLGDFGLGAPLARPSMRFSRLGSAGKPELQHAAFLASCRWISYRIPVPLQTGRDGRACAVGRRNRWWLTLRVMLLQAVRRP